MENCYPLTNLNQTMDKLIENLRFQVKELQQNLNVTNLLKKKNYYHKIKPKILIYKPENICNQYYLKIS